MTQGRRRPGFRESPLRTTRPPMWARPFVFLEDSIRELLNVHWPSQAETLAHVTAVFWAIFAVLIIAGAVVVLISAHYIH